jgi:hypothetical protein
MGKTKTSAREIREGSKAGQAAATQTNTVGNVTEIAKNVTKTPETNSKTTELTESSKYSALSAAWDSTKITKTSEIFASDNTEEYPSFLENDLGNGISNTDSTIQSVVVKRPTLKNILGNNGKWKELNLPQITYRVVDFIYCKWYGIIPNNYMITLTRSNLPVNDEGLYSLSGPVVEDKSKNVETGSFSAKVVAQAITYLGKKTGNSLSSILGFSGGMRWGAPIEANDAIIESNAIGGSLTLSSFGMSEASANIFTTLTSGIKGSNLATEVTKVFKGLGQDLGKEAGSVGTQKKAPVDAVKPAKKKPLDVSGKVLDAVSGAINVAPEVAIAGALGFGQVASGLAGNLPLSVGMGAINAQNAARLVSGPTINPGVDLRATRDKLVKTMPGKNEVIPKGRTKAGSTTDKARRLYDAARLVASGRIDTQEKKEMVSKRITKELDGLSDTQVRDVAKKMGIQVTDNPRFDVAMGVLKAQHPGALARLRAGIRQRTGFSESQDFCEGCEGDCGQKQQSFFEGYESMDRAQMLEALQAMGVDTSVIDDATPDAVLEAWLKSVGGGAEEAPAEESFAERNCQKSSPV